MIVWKPIWNNETLSSEKWPIKDQMSLLTYYWKTKMLLHLEQFSAGVQGQVRSPSFLLHKCSNPSVVLLVVVAEENISVKSPGQFSLMTWLTPTKVLAGERKKAILWSDCGGEVRTVSVCSMKSKIVFRNRQSIINIGLPGTPGSQDS